MADEVQEIWALWLAGDFFWMTQLKLLPTASQLYTTEFINIINNVELNMNSANIIKHLLQRCHEDTSPASFDGYCA